jgi:hypothetical protein
MDISAINPRQRRHNTEAEGGSKSKALKIQYIINPLILTAFLPEGIVSLPLSS